MNYLIKLNLKYIKILKLKALIFKMIKTLNLDISIKTKFNENGFVKIENLFTNNEINLIKKDIVYISKILKKKKYKHLHLAPNGRVNSIHDINKLKIKSYLNQLSKKKKLQNIVNYILNTNKTIVRNLEFFLKPKKTGQSSPFHQDNYFWNIKKAEALNVWIACSNSDKNNGGICYLERSHKKGLLKHELSYKKGTSQQIVSKALKKIKYKKKYPSLKPGDCIIHHPEVIHGSAKNLSNRDRIGVVISYKKKTAKYDLKKLKIYKKNVEKNIQFFKSKL